MRTNDSHRATDPSWEWLGPDPSQRGDPRDEAYTEAYEEIDRLKKIIERLNRQLEAQ